MYKIIGADQREYGPVNAEQIQQWIVERRLQAQSLAQREGDPDWKPLSEFPEFGSFLAGTPAQPALPPAESALPQATRPPGSRTNPMATAGLVMGILSMTLGMCCCYGFPFNLLGIIFSVLAIQQINRNPVVESGKSLATAGLVLSVLSIVLALLVMVLGFAVNYREIWRELKHL
jgi:Domain of unknown function (DUF4190)/GYF domain 2